MARYRTKPITHHHRPPKNNKARMQTALARTLDLAFLSAPASSSSRAQSVRPLTAAHIRAVDSTCAHVCQRHCTAQIQNRKMREKWNKKLEHASKQSQSITTKSNKAPSHTTALARTSFLASLSAPASSSNRTQSTRSLEAASISAVHPSCESARACVPMCRRRRRRPQCHCRAHIAHLTPHTIATTPSAVPKEMHSASPKDKEKDKNVKFENHPKPSPQQLRLRAKPKTQQVIPHSSSQRIDSAHFNHSN
jgi:hypothetical protein